MRCAVLALLAILGLAAPALAGEGAPSPTPTNSTVLMSPLALPIVVDGRLINYVFVTLRLGLSPRADAPTLRAMEPYFRDDLVRAGHRTPFVRSDTYSALDDNRLKATVLRDAAQLVGPGLVTSVQIVREQAQHYSGLPTPPGAARH
jgi:hypothetical protein